MKNYFRVQAFFLGSLALVTPFQIALADPSPPSSWQKDLASYVAKDKGGAGEHLKTAQAVAACATMPGLCISLVAAGALMACGPAPSGPSTERYAYVANGGSNSVGVYSIDLKTGALTPLSDASTASMGTLNGPSSVTVDPSNKYVYVADGNGNTISAFSINPSNGALTLIPNGGTVSTGARPSSVAVHPSGKFVYTANYGGFAGSGGNNISAFSVGANGALTPLPGATATVAAGNGPVAIHPTGNFAYVANMNGYEDPSISTISAYKIDATSGALTPVAGAPTVATGAAHPTSVTVDPSGNFAYATSAGDANNPGAVTAYSVDSNSGALTPLPTGSVVPAGYGAMGINIHPSGKFAYVINYGGPNGQPTGNTVSIYTVNSGALTPAGTAPTGNYPMGMTIDPTGHFAYVANIGNTVSQFSIDQSTGALTPMAGAATVQAGYVPTSIAITTQN